jgi:hypothetical protein
MQKVRIDTDTPGFELGNRMLLNFNSSFNSSVVLQGRFGYFHR